MSSILSLFQNGAVFHLKNMIQNGSGLKFGRSSQKTKTRKLLVVRIVGCEGELRGGRFSVAIL
jgi:hypothetical protein